MTKIRAPLSTEHVLSNVIKKLDENDIKNITNKSVSHFRKCSDPDDKDHALYLSDAITGRDKALEDLRKKIVELNKSLLFETLLP